MNALKSFILIFASCSLLACSSSQESTQSDVVIVERAESFTIPEQAWNDTIRTLPGAFVEPFVFSSDRPEGRVEVRVTPRKREAIVSVTVPPRTIEDKDTVSVTNTQTTVVNEPTFWEELSPWMAVLFVLFVVGIIAWTLFKPRFL